VKDTATILELPSVSTPSHGAIRQFQLSLNDVTVQLSSLGASITSVLLPNYSLSATGGAPPQVDDVVLSYKSSREQLEHKNTQFLGAIVGRVANRIKGGTFQLKQEDLSDKLSTYTLDLNDGNINHLHAGMMVSGIECGMQKWMKTKSNSL